MPARLHRSGSECCLVPSSSPAASGMGLSSRLRDAAWEPASLPSSCRGHGRLRSQRGSIRGHRAQGREAHPHRHKEHPCATPHQLCADGTPRRRVQGCHGLQCGRSELPVAGGGCAGHPARVPSRARACVGSWHGGDSVWRRHHLHGGLPCAPARTAGRRDRGSAATACACVPGRGHVLAPAGPAACRSAALRPPHCT